MPVLFVLSLVLQFVCLVHMVRSGRPYWWAWIIVLGMGLGAAVYIVTQILPDLGNDPRARRAARGAIKKLDPTRDLRKLRDELSRAETVQNKMNLGAEFLALGEAKEAEEIFAQCLTGLNAHAPDLLLALAQAQFAQGKARETHETLTRLIQLNPEFRSNDGHLLFARALEALGRADEALNEYAALEESYPGEEARVRYARLLITEHRIDEAKSVLEKVRTRVRVAPKYYQKAQREWSDEAGSILQALR